MILPGRNAGQRFAGLETTLKSLDLPVYVR